MVKMRNYSVFNNEMNMPRIKRILFKIKQFQFKKINKKEVNKEMMKSIKSIEIKRNKLSRKHKSQTQKPLENNNRNIKDKYYGFGCIWLCMTTKWVLM